MANNHMWLVYRPTSRGVKLGKRMGFGWYGVPPEAAVLIQRLFEHAENYAVEHGEASQDDFLLLMESREGMVAAETGGDPLTVWRLKRESPDGLHEFDLGRRSSGTD